MNEGFKEFMKNPYWEKFYTNAPSDALKERIQFEYEISYRLGRGQETDSLKKKFAEVGKMLTRDDVQYLYDEAYGGQEKSFYKRWLDSFEK